MSQPRKRSLRRSSALQKSVRTLPSGLTVHTVSASVDPEESVDSTPPPPAISQEQEDISGSTSSFVHVPQRPTFSAGANQEPEAPSSDGEVIDLEQEVIDSDSNEDLDASEISRRKLVKSGEAGHSPKSWIRVRVIFLFFDSLNNRCLLSARTAEPLGGPAVLPKARRNVVQMNMIRFAGTACVSARSAVLR